jgi:spermidine/putrescine transport system ATP-binding protein/putrescine transport system ATP-binding protein
VVREVQFFGGISHVMVDVAGFAAPVIASSVGPPTLAPGTAVAVSWAPTDVVLVTAPTTAGAS